jgi:RimJ/RimL family protein N-acetyltransferase
MRGPTDAQWTSQTPSRSLCDELADRSQPFIAEELMTQPPLHTERLRLVTGTPEEARAQVAQMNEQDRKQLSADWLARLAATTTADPWVLGFSVVRAASDEVIGSCGFKGPPDADGMVEIAYGIASEHQNKGYATEAALALVQFARADAQVRTIRAHTIESVNASTRVLVKCGFHPCGQVVDPEDGPVFRWEIKCAT